MFSSSHLLPVKCEQIKRNKSFVALNKNNTQEFQKDILFEDVNRKVPCVLINKPRILRLNSNSPNEDNEPIPVL